MRRGFSTVIQRGGRIEGIMRELAEAQVRRDRDPKNGVFLMVRFRNSDLLTTVTATIEEVLSEYDLDLVRADWHQFHEELAASLR